MKRWLFAIMTITLSFSINNIFAKEQVQIYDDPEIVNEGTVTINFLSKIRDDAEEEIDNPKVEGVQIELYYRENGQMVNIKELPQFIGKNLNLVSDANGQIILNNFPYGFYEYYIIYVPFGYKLDSEVRKIDLNILNSYINKYDFIVEDLQFAEGSTIIEEDPIEEDPIITEDDEKEVIIEDNTSNESIKNDHNIDENIGQSNSYLNLNNTSINSIIKDSYDNEKEDSDSNDVLNDRITNKIKPIKNNIKLDIISAMKNIKINDNIKTAILDNYRDFHKIYIISDMPPVNKNKKHKKIITIEKVAMKNSSINNINYVHLGVQRKIMS